MNSFRLATLGTNDRSDHENEDPSNDKRHHRDNPPVDFKLEQFWTSTKQNHRAHNQRCYAPQSQYSEGSGEHLGYEQHKGEDDEEYPRPRGFQHGQ